MVAGNHSQITLEATYKVTQMLQRKKQARFILYCVVGGMKPELQHPLSSQFFLHILTLNSNPKPAADPSYIQIVYHFSLCVVDDDIPQTFKEHDLRQEGRFGKKKLIG